MDAQTRILEAALRVCAETGYRGATPRRSAQDAAGNKARVTKRALVESY